MKSTLLINNLKTFWFQISDKIRFLLIGGFNAGISYLIFVLFCYVAGVDFYQISLAISWMLSSFVSFTTQRYLVFNSEENFIKQYCKCCATWFFSYLINAVVLEVFVKSIKLNVYASQIIATGVCAIFTYILFKKFAFKSVK